MIKYTVLQRMRYTVTSKRCTILLIVRENLICGLVLLSKQTVINDKITIHINRLQDISLLLRLLRNIGGIMAMMIQAIDKELFIYAAI